MNSNNSTVSHLSDCYDTKLYDQEKENKNNQQPTFLEYCQKNQTITLNSITKNLTNTIAQIQETENSLYETLQKYDTSEEKKQQIRVRIIKLQMLQVIAQFKTDTKSHLSNIQKELIQIQHFIQYELLQF